MDFFGQQDQARKRSKMLIAYFISAVVAIVITINIVAVIVAGFIWDSQHRQNGGKNPYFASPFHVELFVPVTLGTLAVIGLGSAYKTSQLSHGGESLALMLGGRRIVEGTKDPRERQLLNIVEEMAIASGVPVPPVFIMDDEHSINAFAAGLHPDDAVIGVSRGSIEYLTRDELQGVIAHEYSHILNGDMRLNFRLIGIVHGILVIALVGWFVLRSVMYSRPRGNSKDKGGGIAVAIAIGVSLLIIGGIGWMFGKLIKSALSRQREYLADAAAVQFTRYPEGIGGALIKIGAMADQSRLQNAEAQQASHMFFSNISGVTSMAASMMSTHPPLDKRIQAVMPNWDGRFPQNVSKVAVRKDDLKSKQPPASPAGMPGGAPMPIDPAGILSSTGMPNPAQTAFALALIEELSESVREASADPFSAQAIVFTVLLDRDTKNTAIREKQLAAIRASMPAVADQVMKLIPDIDRMSDPAHLTLVEHTFRSLHQLVPAQYEAFRKIVITLIEADDKIDLREYTIRVMLLRHLDVHFGLTRRPPEKYTRIAPVVPSVNQVLSTLAHLGTSDLKEAAKAHAAGLSQALSDQPNVMLLPREKCQLGALDKALDQLSQLSGPLKRQMLEACIATAQFDGILKPREISIIQAVAAALGCPIPHLQATEEGKKEG